MLSSYEFLASYLRARFADDERGASLVEYALLVALIAVVCIVAVSFLGQGVLELHMGSISGATSADLSPLELI
jgi:pilus assembly protein Flp/PilA